MVITLDGEGLTIEKVVSVARYNEKIALSPKAKKRIQKCRQMVERKIKEKEVMYGINTGIGELAEVVVPQKDVEEYQRYLIYSHAAGIGDPAPIEFVRGAMGGRINVLCRGKSGCRPEIPVTLAAMLNR